MTETPSPDDHSLDASTETEDLVFQCLEADDLDAALEALRASHPDRIGAVEAAITTLRQQGLLESGPPSEVGAIPERLGPFRLIRQLGAGGMGIVYLAEQEDLNRQVAVKLIRPEHLYFPGSRERFRREVEAVASLQHVAIASVFTVGEDNSMPYFSMEFIDGPSLATVVNRLAGQAPATLTAADVATAISPEAAAPQKLTQSATGRSSLPQSWVDTCVGFARSIGEALQHAHERGVLHRDVKPSNILVAANGHVKLVDFGLARSEDANPLTASTSQIGSLPYVPPENLDETPTIPSVRQDVYALGVTLYELLSLRSPFLRESSLQTRQAIHEGRPAALRGLNPNVSWDLETVCMKAMAPDPKQRYATMAEFVLDLENVLNRRPIMATRPGLWIRVRRWEQRHPTATAVAAVAVLLTATAAIILAWFESSARQESDRLKVAADQRAVEAGEVTSFLIELFEFASPDKSLGGDMPVGLLLDQGANRIREGLEGQPEATARLMATFGRVYSWLGESAKAASFFGMAADRFEELQGPDSRDVLETRLNEADSYRRLGDYQQAESLLQIVADRLVDRQPHDPFLVNDLKRKRSGLAHLRGDAETAERLLSEVLADCRTRPDNVIEVCTSLRALGVFFENERRFEEAHPLLDEAWTLCRQAYPDDHPVRIDVERRMAVNLSHVGQQERAEEVADSALAMSQRVFGNDHPRTAFLRRSIAEVYRNSGQIDRATAEMEKVTAIIRSYRDASKNYFARSLNDLAVNYHTLGRYSEARDLLNESLAASREAFPGDHELTAVLMTNLAEALGELGEQKEATRLLDEALAMTRRLDPDARNLAGVINSVAFAKIRAGIHGEARTLLDEAIANAAKWHMTWDRGRAHALRAYLSNVEGEPVAGEKDALQAIEFYDQARKGDHNNKALSIYHVGWALLDQGKGLAAAEPYFKRSLAMYERMGQNYPDKAYVLNHYGLELTRDRPKEALPMLEEALAMRRKSLPRTANWRLVSTLHLANCHIRLEDFAAAEPLMLELHEVIMKLAKPGSPGAVASARRMIDLYTKWGRPESAKQYRALLPAKK